MHVDVPVSMWGLMTHCVQASAFTLCVVVFRVVLGMPKLHIGLGMLLVGAYWVLIFSMAMHLQKVPARGPHLER